jgi:hypothetical protein
MAMGCRRKRPNTGGLNVFEMKAVAPVKLVATRPEETK